jgi:hypothetical protein
MTKEKIVLDDLTDDTACAVAQMYQRMIWMTLNGSQRMHGARSVDRATHKLRRALTKVEIDRLRDASRGRWS